VARNLDGSLKRDVIAGTDFARFKACDVAIQSKHVSQVESRVCLFRAVAWNLTFVFGGMAEQARYETLF
jgi:hypothetical protein